MTEIWQNQQRLLDHRLQELGLNPAGDLTVYGQHLISTPSAPLEASGQTLVSPSYVLGPGDELGVFLLGKAPREFQLPVLPEGKVYVGGVGIVELAGQTLGEAAQTLRNIMAKYYDTSSFSMALLRPKTVVVEVVGEVRRPGRYTLSGVRSVLDAVLEAGGLTPLGSLRNLRVQHVVTGSEEFLDLYQLLLLPQQPSPALLQAGDRIFVPPASAWAAISGEVHRPGIFELSMSDGESVHDFLELAGGHTDMANLATVEVSRLRPDGTRYLEIWNVVDTIIANGAARARVRHGDRLTIYSNRSLNHAPVVSIYGEVKSPGDYPYDEEMRVSDLVTRAGGLTREALTLEAELVRIDPGTPPRREKIALRANGGTDKVHPPATLPDSLLGVETQLQEDDQIFIRRIPEWRLGAMVEVIGEVKFPGSYALDWGVNHLSDGIRLAGGLTEYAAIDQARLHRAAPAGAKNAALDTERTLPPEALKEADKDVLRQQHSRNAMQLVSVNFRKLLLENDQRYDVLLEPGDVIEIPRAQALVYVTGAVGLPGGVPFQSDGNVKDYVARAGGPGLHADMRKAKVIRASGEVQDDEDAADLRPGDTIWVPTRGQRSTWSTIRDMIALTAQLAAIYVVIYTAVR